MDDADGGLRGVRAQPCPGLRRALEDHWGLGWFAEVVDLGGSSSLNLLVGDAGRGYVVRVHRPHVTPDRLGAIHQARRALLAGGVPCAPPVPTRQGRPWVRFEGRLVEVEVYVDYDAVMDSWQRLRPEWTPPWTSRSLRPSGSRCRWRWPANPCRRLAGGWRG